MNEHQYLACDDLIIHCSILIERILRMNPQWIPPSVRNGTEGLPHKPSHREPQRNSLIPWTMWLSVPDAGYAYGIGDDMAQTFVEMQPGKDAAQ